MEELSASYVPEWHFDRENPDIGSVIAKIFAGQMEENITRYNQVLDQYHTEFVNMLGISLLPAKPATAIVLLNLVQDTIPGVEVYKGTKLLAETDGEERIVFETQHNLYVTSASLEYVFMTGEEDGRVVPLKGRFDEVELVETSKLPGEALEADDEENTVAEMKKFRLFGRTEKGLGKNALLFYHSVVFDVERDHIYLKIAGNRKLVEGIEGGAYQVLYYTEEGLLPVESLSLGPDEDTLILEKEKPCEKVEIDGMSCSLLAIVAEDPVRESLAIDGIWASSSGKPIPADAVGNGVTDFDVESFEPFGDTLALFQECYIGSNDYFGKSGALVRVAFDVSYKEHPMLNVVLREDAKLKVIKRKPKVIWTDTAAEARVEEISLEYYNGRGWKKLNCREEVQRMFADNNAGHYEFSFFCPSDWQETGVGAYQGRCIRMQILKSDNCYMRPCVHFYPQIKALRLSFSYENHYMEPEKLISVAGTRKLDLTGQVKAGKKLCAFSRSIYNSDALYLGFTRKPESGPVSLLFQMEDGVRFEGSKCRFEYSTLHGFKQMKVLDYTVDMSRSGTIMFMPQADMHAVTLEGKKACWIRISRVGQTDGSEEGACPEETLPFIKRICFNAVQASNVETREEEDYYLEESGPDITVSLGVPHILDIDLWVNERGTYSRAQMQQLLKESPDRVRAEYDMLGEFTSFYVKWQEADQLDDPPSRRCYMLDRMNSQLIFGNGITTEIPKVLDDVAFKATIRCCSGREGNVGPGQINEAMGNIMFVEEITNPVKAYGGSSIESLDRALIRGANILRSRKRLVSMEDYVQEILSFSDTIDKVKCVTGRTIQGEKRDDAVTFVILLRDFAAGSYSFHSLAGALKRQLLTSCELTLPPEDLYIVEPIFVSVSVDLWVEVPHMDDSFEIQNLLCETLERYLNPVSDAYTDGWDIGVLPKRSQILMKLNVLKKRAVIRKMLVTVGYTDQSGTHERDLEDVEESPFMVSISGNHRVNIMVSEP